MEGKKYHRKTSLEALGDCRGRVKFMGFAYQIPHKLLRRLAPPPRMLVDAGTAAPRRDAWISLVRIVTLLTLIPASWFGIIPTAHPAVNEIVLLLGGYVIMLTLCPRWLPFLQKMDLVVALDIIMITLVVIISGDLNSPFRFLYYLTILEAARLNLRQAVAASVAMAGIIILLWTRFGHAEMFRTVGFWLGIFISGGFGLALYLGTLIQEHRIAEASLRLATIVDSSDDAIIGTTLDGVILSWNLGAEKIYGYSAAEVIGRPISVLAPQDRATEYVEICRRLMGGEHVAHFETIRVRKDGTYFHLSLTVSLLRDSAGKFVGTAGIGRDITERTRGEEAVWKARDAERANQAKSEFLSHMSHELRTPLNAILGFAQLLEMDSLDPSQREGVEHILAASRHLLELINEVLEIARIEAGRLAIEWNPVSLQEVMRETLDLITPLAAERNVRLDTVEGAFDRCVRGDRKRIRQVLLNLLSNAVKYNHRGGLVTVASEDIAEGRIRIKVTDTGAGIPPDRMDRLFTPFDRLGAEQTGVEGNGLGLALSKRLVEAMGGRMGVESTVGQGSTFWVDLPLEKTQ